MPSSPKRLFLQLTLFLGTLAAVAGVLVLYARQNPGQVAPAPGGTYREGVVGDLSLLYPFWARGEGARTVADLLFEPLARIGPEGRVEPYLLESWAWEEGGRAFLVRLRPNLRWHDQTPVTSRDLIFTLALFKSGQVPDPTLQAFWQDVEAEVVDERTVRFRLPTPYAPFPSRLTFPILPSHRLQALPPDANAWGDENLVGTGPYRFVSREGNRVVLEAFPGYFRGGQPFIQKLEFVGYETPLALVNGLSLEEVDGGFGVREDDWELLTAETRERYQVFRGERAETLVLFFNVQQPPLDEAKVRRALLWALDRERLTEVLPGSTPADGPVLDATWAYSGTLRRRARPEEAAALLDQTYWLDVDGDGIRERDALPLTFKIYLPPDETLLAVGRELVRQFREVGVQAELAPVEPGALSELVLTGNFQALLQWIPASPDPDGYALWHSSQIPEGRNLSRLEDPEIDRDLELGRQLVEEERRLEWYQEFQRRFRELAPALYLIHPGYLYVVREEVKGVQVPFRLWTPADRFRTVHDWYLLTRKVVGGPTPTPLPGR